MRADQTEVMSSYGSRRSSYYGGGHDQNRFSQASNYHPNRQSVRDNYDHGYGGGPVGGPQRVRYGNRMQSDPGWNRGAANNVYPQNGYQQSRDTVNTNGSNGSHSDGPYSNEPGSENSSIERGVPVRFPQQPQQDVGEQYGYSNYNRGPIMEEYGQGQAPQHSGYPPQQHQPQNGGPPPPPKHVTQPSAPIKLGSSGPPVAGADRPNLVSKNSTDDKRRSWFKKRFSKD